MRGVRWFWIAATLGVGGCALTSSQKAAVSRVARVSTQVGDLAADEIVRFRKASIELNAQSVALRGSADPGCLAEQFTPDLVAARVRPAKALKAYGELLVALVEDTSAKDFSELREAFVDSFRSLGEEKAMRDAQIEDLGTMLQDTGGFTGAWKRSRLVKAVATAAAGTVDRICDRLIADCEETGATLVASFGATVRRVRADAAAALATGERSYSERLVASRALAMADEEEAHAALIARRTPEVLRGIKSANRRMVLLLEDGRTPSGADIEAIGAQAKHLLGAVKGLGLP